MIRDITIEVCHADTGKRIDAFLSTRFLSSSRSSCREAILTGHVLLNGRTALKGAKLKKGDIVCVRELEENVDNRVRPDLSVNVKIIFQDNALIAADKQAGIPVQPLSNTETGTLMNGLVARFPELAEIGDSPLMAGALHRIDTGTSGIVLAARDNAVFDKMRELFSARKVKKTYLARVTGHIAVGGHIECDLVHDPSSSVCRMIDAKSLGCTDGIRLMRASTSYKPVSLIGRDTLLEVVIYTGVTHQIRAQLAMIGHPVVGDNIYGIAGTFPECGHCLHAFAVDFAHPVSNMPVHIETAMPAWAKC